MMRHEDGFTMIELVMVILMLGILAVFVMPRMDMSAYRALEFHDKTVAALRYAQKTATSHRRLVCVAFFASTVTSTIAQANPATTCGPSLMLPGGNSNVVTSSDTTNAIFSPVPADLYFQPDGRGTTDGSGLTVYTASPTINGAATSITVVGATGYVQ
jgi:prepilin-type N-terminal cleavage/methylation domain-containing protein